MEIDPATYNLPTRTAQPGKLKVSLHRLLIEVGIVQSLATSSSDPRSWFALYRYAGDFAGTSPSLRFYHGVLAKDPRLTAVASEEVGTGICCYVLREHLNLPHIADVYPCLYPPRRVSPELEYIPGSGSTKRPDYFCQDNAGDAVLAESKGAKGNRNTIARRIVPKGWDQVQNVRPINLPLRSLCGRVVIGTHFRVDGTRARYETTTILKDPEGEPGANRNTDSDMVLRLSYAKCLRFMGQDGIAERLIMRVPIEGFDILANPDDRPRLPKIGNMSFVPFGWTPFGDLIGLNVFIAKALFVGSPEELRKRLFNAISRFAEDRFVPEAEGYVLPNGVVVAHNAERLIEE